MIELKPGVKFRNIRTKEVFTIVATDVKCCGVLINKAPSTDLFIYKDAEGNHYARHLEIWKWCEYKGYEPC